MSSCSAAADDDDDGVSSTCHVVLRRPGGLLSARCQVVLRRPGGLLHEQIHTNTHGMEIERYCNKVTSEPNFTLSQSLNFSASSD